MGLPLKCMQKQGSSGTTKPLVFLALALVILAGGLFPCSAEAGEQASPENRNYGFFMTMSDEQLEAMPFVNSSWVRMAGVAVWNVVEMEPGSGVYDFSVTDPVVQEANTLNLSLILTINPVHELDSGASQKGLPTDMNAYKAFVSALVERYDGDGVNDAPGSPVVKYWQIGNEPDNLTQGGQGIEWTDTPEDFAVLVKETATAIRSSDATAHIVLGGLARGSAGLSDFYDPMFTALDALGGGPYFDIFDVHWFGLASTNHYLGLASVVDDINNLFAAHGYGAIPIWATEVATYSGTPDGYVAQSEDEQARDLAKRLLYYRQLGLDKVFWEIYREFHNFKDVPNGYFDNTGLVNNPLNDGSSSKKKAYYTYAFLAEKLDGAVVQSDSLFTQQVEASVLMGCEFTNFGRTYYALWADNPALAGTEVCLPTTCQELTVYRLVPDDNNAIPAEVVPVTDGNFCYTLGVDPILIECDGDGPSLSISAPTDGLLVNADSVDVQGITDSLEPVKLEGPFGATPQTTTADSDGNFTFSNVALSEGNNALTVTAGSTTTRSKTFRVVRDTISPAISVTYPEAGAVLNTPELAIEGLADMGQEVTFDNPPSGTPLTTEANVVNRSFVFSTETFPDGLNTVELSATDAAGNSSTVSSSFTIDTVLPEITGVTAWQNTYEAGPYAVEASITDNDAVYSANLAYTINGGELIEVPMDCLGGSTWRGEIPAQPADTNVTYFVKARDIAGNLATNPVSSEPLSFRVVAAPVGVITVEPASTSVPRGGILNVTGTVRNPYKISQTINVKIVVVLPNKTQMTLLDVNIPLGPEVSRTQALSNAIPKTAPLGTYTYSAIASDLLGAELGRDSFNFTVTQ